MSAEIVENWLQSGRNAVINQISVKPIEHALLTGKPLSSQKGQAEAFFLIDDNGNWWILKKFHNACSLDHHYLHKISSLLPKENGFLCGTKRQVLSPRTLRKNWGCYYSNDLDQWLDGTILMPRTMGFDWATMADEIRDGTISLDQSQRFTISRNLTQLVQALETHRCCHRDLSCGNVFIDVDTLCVSLIDFDSLYHPSLMMPPATTCGTTGYTAHHAWNNDKLDPRKTWCKYADRYALALLNAEILLLTQGAKVTGDGGMFDQDELRKQSGKGIKLIIGQLKKQYSSAERLLDTVIHSSSFADCPSPQDWNRLFNTIPGLTFMPPSLADFQDAHPEQLRDILNKCKTIVPTWAVPSLHEMSNPMLQIPNIPYIKPPSFNIASNTWDKQ